VIARVDSRQSFRRRVLLGSMLGGLALSCSEQPVSVAVRSLEQSGNVAFLCLSRNDREHPGRPMQHCGKIRNSSSEDPGTLHAFVTQMTRGEVAVIDLNEETVVDLNPSKPGFNFIPVGAVPVDIAATPGGTAAFVGSAEFGREGIWIVPTRTVVQGNPHLTSFAACALPSAPGEMIVLTQPTPDIISPSKCNAEPYDDPDHPQGDLALEHGVSGTLKLVTTLPDLGAVVVMDAQQLIDQPPGSFRACPIERWVSLQVDLPPALPQQRVPEGGFPPGESADGSVCAMTQRPDIPTASNPLPRPSGLAFDPSSSRLFIADEDAPVIHVLDASSPCELSESSPLLPMSVVRPERKVVTRSLAVSPTTSAGKKYLYATDLLDGSVMIFDVSLQSTDRTPLLRPYPWRNPFQPLDRLSFSVPVRDVEFVLRDRPVTDPSAGATAVGLACDPTHDDSLGARYRTSSDFSSGARPYNLRGVFATIALTNGQIMIVDVDDFDAACRRPKTACDGDEQASFEGASGELSCLMVQPHQPRSSAFLHLSNDANGRVPGLQSYPVLSLGTSILPTDQTADGVRYPKLLAPSAPGIPLMVGGRVADEPQTDPLIAEKNSVVFDLREPRVHVEQNWSVAFEGAIPGFEGHVGRLGPASEDGRTTFFDGGAFFCDRGVHDFDAALTIGKNEGISDPATMQTWARDHQDVLQITEDFLLEDDPYWDSVADHCSWLQCRETFGTVRDPKSTRDLPITEAYQGSLVVEGVWDFVRCCFPTLVSYTVRPRNQWVVTGTAAGFLHRVVPDPFTGRCVDSCDPNRSLLNARVLERERSEPVPALDDPGVFRNPALQFVLWRGTAPSERKMAFTFVQKDGFYPLFINLAAATSFVQPQSLTLAPTGELAIADGSAQGLILVDLGSIRVSRSFF